MSRYLISLLLLLPALAAAAVQPPVIHHELRVEADPDTAMLRVTDELLPRDRKETLEFLLHENLEPRLLSPGGRLVRGDRVKAAVPARRWRLELDDPGAPIRLAYAGRIHHPPEAGALHATPGTVSARGIQLSASTLWYPWIPGHLVTFRLHLSLPDGWHGISQGKPSDDDRSWEETQPQDDLYLVAGPYHRYEKRFGPLRAMVWLRQPDEALAQRYLEATGRYVDLYSRLVGPYPYAKFALVENFWESGYGMPSFTLLGPTVIRLPFILHSSYPHEILHNWWGNSVYVDYDSGNWSEGLTSYLADHLLRERRGGGAAYRRDVLLKYANWVKAGNDTPLVRFRGRHGEASQAAGYGRMLMFMHMLRLELGDEAFVEGLRHFYRENRFRITGFDDLRTAFEAASGRKLGVLFEQWTRRTGAPALVLEAVKVEAGEHGYRLTGSLRQTQEEAPFRLRAPLYVQLEKEPEPRLHWLTLEGRRLEFELVLEKRPLRLRLDPLFDLFRRLAPAEIPSSLGALFAAERIDVILPSRAPGPGRDAYRTLAEAWKRRYPRVRILTDSELDRLPKEGAVWVLGLENRFAGQVWEPLGKERVRLSDETVVLAGHRHPLEGASLVVTRRATVPLGLLVLGDAKRAASLARRLPHYGKYSYLLCDAEGKNRAKGQWPAGGGALEAVLDPSAPAMTVPDHPPLARLAR